MGFDYQVFYSNNTDAGTATVTLTGINFYNGTYTTNIGPVSDLSQLVRLAGDGSPYQVTLYAPPKTPFEGWCETLAVTLTVDEQNIVMDVAVK